MTQPSQRTARPGVRPPRRAGARWPLTLTRTPKGRAIVLALATVTMAVEIGALLVGARVDVGSFALSASLVPSLLVLAALGLPASGRAGDRDRLVPFWIAMAAGMGLGYVVFARTGDGIDLLALLVAAANEEVVYRFAVPLVIASGLMVLRLPARQARIVGYVVGGTWWVFLPGHQAQTDDIGALLTYAAFAVISALVVARSRALIPMSVAHCVLNVITIAAVRGDISGPGRGALTICLLFLLVGTFAWPGDRVRRSASTSAGAKQDLITDTVIDLRDGQRPSVQTGQEVTWIEDPELDDAPTPASVEASDRD